MSRRPPDNAQTPSDREELSPVNTASKTTRPDPKAGDSFYAGMDRVTVNRVADDNTWADIVVEQFGTGATWRKRQPLPFPADWDAPHDSALDRRIADEVLAERARQDARWGVQNHPNGTGETWVRDQNLLADAQSCSTASAYTNRIRQRCDDAAAAGTLTWRHILYEEVAEALTEHDRARLRRELIQVAATAIVWVAGLDRATLATDETPG